MNNFEIAESEGRVKALNALSQIEFTDDDNYSIIPTDQYCKWDFEIRENGSNHLIAVIEAKDRKMDSTDSRIVYGGVQLEEKKYSALRRKAEHSHADAYYLATFTDGRFFLFDVVGSEVTEDYRLCNKTTAEDNGKIEKHCYYFALKDNCFEGWL